MYSEKQGVSDLTAICVAHGLVDIVISPGSRNAPLTISFSNHPDIHCISITDERSAAFFALGMSQQSGKPTGLLCTSGSALLNYAPAIAEAYYQGIPLIVFSADRPSEWVDQGDGQTIRQPNVYANFIKKSVQVPQDTSHPDALWHSNRLVSEALNEAVNGRPGPVHINLPFREPLYDQGSAPSELVKKINLHKVSPQLNSSSLETLQASWLNASKKLLIVGQSRPDNNLNNVLNKLAQDPSVVILTETTSNIFGERFLPCIDRIVDTITEAEAPFFQPDLLVTLGDAIVSKKVKAFLRKHKPKAHWHVSVYGPFQDTFQCLTDSIPIDPTSFLDSMAISAQGSYSNTWQQRDKTTDNAHSTFMESISFCDLSAFEAILASIPHGSNLQLGNSTPIRYAQLFKTNKHLTYDSNRGTSGIDGCVSTAVGAAYSSQKPTTLIVGDLSFFYDSNGLWNSYLSNQLRVILINNSGGGIFRIIKGPSTTEVLEKHFEATHNQTAQGIAENFGLLYRTASNKVELNQQLNEIYEPSQQTPVILEVFTDGMRNASVLKEYFKQLKPH